MGLRDVDGPRVGDEVVAQSRIADPLDPVADRRDGTSGERVTEDSTRQISPQSSGSTSSPTIHAENIERSVSEARHSTSTRP
jgi:hypothetical protein